ncbi:hypothetical protein FAM09_28225 [Niastella caeni]|uniref:Uncharacterized protein n=1 Tax=Niastella caeni TaxID=2569763 RepID=A0A4S8HAW4_9BACT|nr:hypothetical protein [Niastella caeni]THU32070.1 hypothetical protein FAM09_28225 [Niastella caeni]
MKKICTPFALPYWTIARRNACMVVVPLHTPKSNIVNSVANFSFTSIIPDIAAVPLELACVVP